MPFKYTRHRIRPGANRDGEHYLVVAKFTERLGVSKRVEEKGNKYK
jgi:hypothetical protein